MKDVALSRASRIAHVLCAAVAACTITGCGFSSNSAAEKGPADSFAPIVSCSANPASVVSGNSAQITTMAVSPLGLPLTYSYGITGGSLTSQGKSATLDTKGASGSIAVTCKVTDTKGNTSSFTTTVVVQAYRVTAANHQSSRLVLRP
jgi:hypothetical protein